MATAASDTSEYLDVPFHSQKQSNWCWAACFKMVFEFFGFSIKQCKIVDQLLGISSSSGSKGSSGSKDCCDDGSQSKCNKTLSDSEICDGWDYWDYQYSYSFAQVSFADLQSSINSGEPLEVGLSWTSGGGHVAIVNGWDTSNSDEKVYVSDPGNSDGSYIDYSELQTAYGSGVWDATWIGISD